MIINEWQLNSKLNSALQRTQRADFSLYLSFLSPEVEEFAQFYTPDAVNIQLKTDLYRRLGISVERKFAMAKEDVSLLFKQSEALQKGGLAQLKLASSLNSPPLTMHDDKKRLSADVWQNISLHCRRRVMQQVPDRPEANPAGLYEVLQQLNHVEAA
jgi:predicted phage tail protein